MAESEHAPIDVAFSLAKAMVLAAPAPVLLLDGAFNVVVASQSFTTNFAVDPKTVVGRSLFDLGAGEWNVSQLRSLLQATRSEDAHIESYDLDLKPSGQPVRRLTLNAQKLHYDDDGEERLLLTVVDVTSARAAEKLREDLVREKDVLLQEMQHRIANSLQIIASVIMQTARSTSSEETRGHLKDAHHRLMSVATLQHQLSVTPEGQVDLHQYFSKLCDSISASMIGDHNRLSLAATGDDTAVSADVSVSLGLIVTELVINALKHAFPNGRSGGILVDYRSDGQDWALSVTDDGVGMPSTPMIKSGLGTSIIQALSKQLDASVKVTDARPGSKVTVSHSEGESEPAL